MAYSGKYTLVNPHKYLGKRPNDIIWRSTWELKLFKWCDLSPGVVGWVSEELAIWYRSPVDGKKHRYFPDVFLKVRDKTGEIKKYLIEIKPYTQTQPPRPRKQTRALLNEQRTFLINQAKWEAAREFVKGTGVEFIVVTDKDLFGKHS